MWVVLFPFFFTRIIPNSPFAFHFPWGSPVSLAWDEALLLPVPMTAVRAQLTMLSFVP